MSRSASDTPPQQEPDLVLTARYKKADYWERGSKSMAGDPFASVIQLGVGHALTNWEHLENSVAVLFSLFTESGSIAAIRAYGTIIGARARHAAVSEAMDVFFDIRKQQHKKDRSIYDTLVSHKNAATILLANYLSASKRRNDIAHGVCWELSVVKSDTRSWFLVPQLIIQPTAATGSRTISSSKPPRAGNLVTQSKLLHTTRCTARTLTMYSLPRRLKRLRANLPTYMLMLCRYYTS